MEFTLLEQAKTNSPLQSLATNAMEGQLGPTTASTLILIEEMKGGVHCCEGAKVAWLEIRDKCYFNFYSILVCNMCYCTGMVNCSNNVGQFFFLFFWVYHMEDRIR